MQYNEVLTQIHARKTFSTGGPSLERIRRLMDCLGNPQDSYKTIHVAGTNGKGSVCAFTESVLRTAGYRTGLFTSPYLIDFRERIQISGELITEEELVSCFEIVQEQEKLLENAGYEPVNEFEFVTALGFVAFQRAEVEYAVIEVGLGGRTDPTNILKKPEVCCITSISLDHTAILGKTIPEIAGEKAGIIKASVPVVSAKQTAEAETVIRNTAAQHNAEFIYAGSGSRIQMGQNGISFYAGQTEFSIPFVGRYQVENAMAAREVCRCLGFSDAIIQKGFENTVWPGRLQLIRKKKCYLVDAGHNQAGIQTVADALESIFPEKNIVAVMAMMRDKDYPTCIPMIASKCRLLVAASVGLPRSLNPQELAETASEYCQTCWKETVQEAIEQAESLAADTDLILICGSVYAAGEALKYLENR